MLSLATMSSHRISIIALASTVLVSGLALGCLENGEADPLATEEAALKDPSTGAPTCDGKKVLVCHIPPGNPANAHEICVGAPAVAAHVRNHGDPIGPCPSSAPPPDAGTSDDAGSDTGTPPGDGVIIR